MFLFCDPLEWRDDLEALGLQEMVDRITAKGYLAGWVTKVFGPDQGANFYPAGDRRHPSTCQQFEGYWWCGGFGAVQCAACHDLLPGAVYERRCRDRNAQCPYYKGG